MIFPIVTLLGRDNVGKSALFNRLTFTYNALVGVDPGLTRDRRYGSCRWEQYRVIIVDTGGFKIVKKTEIEISIFNQTIYAILEANLILFVVDAKTGLLPLDYDIVKFLYKFEKSIFVVVNKADSTNMESAKLEFFSLGIQTVIFTSASHGFGIDNLLMEIFLFFQKKKLLVEDKGHNDCIRSKIFLQNQPLFSDTKQTDIVTIAIIGAPNVGKSTFINRILGESRVIVCNTPGTTRDNVYVSVMYNNYKYILIDTAGIRKKNKISSSMEEISVIRTLKVIQTVAIVLLLINACNGVSNYDLSLLNTILHSGKSIVIAVNKWDLLSQDLKKEFRVMCNVRMHFIIPFVSINFMSALYGTGISYLFESINKTYRSSIQVINTAYLTRVMHVAISECSPPRVYGKEVKLRYAHIGGRVPFVVIIHGKHATGLPNNYKRYLSNFFLRALKIFGTYIDIRFKESK